MASIFTIRYVLLLLVVIISGISMVSLWHVVPEHLSNLLLYLIAGCLFGSFVYQQRYGHLENEKLIETQLSRAAVLGVILTLTLVIFSFLWEEVELRTVIVAVSGAGAMYGLLREKKPAVAPSRPIQGLRSAPEPPPTCDPLGDTSSCELNWDEMARALTALGDRERQNTLQSFRRICAAADGCHGDDDTDGGDSVRLKQVVWTVRQESQRLIQAAKMAEQEHLDDDMLTKASELVEWALQKTPEITELDISDLLMAKAVADINHMKSDINSVVVDLAELKAIHNVDRDTAVEKSKQRAMAARTSLPLIRSNGFVLSEALIASNEELRAFESITGIQVVSLGPGGGYVTFEGNGRAWALKQAFSEDAGIKVEVQMFEFPSSKVHDDVIRRVKRVRSWKKVTDKWPDLV